VKFVRIRAILTLAPKKKAPRRNPNGEEDPYLCARVVTFRPGQKLKAKVEKAYVEPQSHNQIY